MDIYSKLRIALYICEAVAAITGFLSWKKIGNSYWKWFPVYLLIIFSIEIITESLFNISANYEFNIIIHEYFSIPLQFFFFLLAFLQRLRCTRISMYPVVGMFIYLTALVIDFIFFQNRLWWFMSFSYTIGNTVLLVLAILYFIKLVSGELILKYSSIMMFWVTLGLLIFYLGSFPLYGMYNTLAAKHSSLFNNYWKISYYIRRYHVFIFCICIYMDKTEIILFIIVANIILVIFHR